VKLGVAGLSLVLFSRNEAVTARARGIKSKPKTKNSSRRRAPPPGQPGHDSSKFFFFTAIGHSNVVSSTMYEDTSSEGSSLSECLLSSANLAGDDDECRIWQ